jgi:hypothetical protein
MADAVENARGEASTVVLGTRAAVPATDEPAPAASSRRRRRTVGVLLVGMATLLTVLALADPTGIVPLPGDQPRPPAATDDGEPSADTDPAGGAGGERQTRSGDPATVPGPAGDQTSTAPDGGADPDSDDADEPDPTSSPEPSTPSEPSAPPVSDDDETGSADPEPTTGSDEQSAEPVSSPAGESLG